MVLAWLGNFGDIKKKVLSVGLWWSMFVFGVVCGVGAVYGCGLGVLCFCGGVE